VFVIVGAPGAEEYGKSFTHSATLWQQAGAKTVMIGMDQSTNALAQLRQRLTAEPKDSSAELWLVLLGHGTFDGKEAKFNLRGSDLSAAELASLLQPFRRPMAIINCAASSGPFIKALSATNRVVITATKSGHEQNYARFGQFISEAISNPQADLDKDGQTSLLEAFLAASSHVAEFYKSEGRLATEHALLDDNGDGLGTPADWFRGVRAVKKPAGGAALDGMRAHQFHLVRSETERALPATWRARRDELERRLTQLRDSKADQTEEDYYQKLEEILFHLAQLYKNAPNGTNQPP